MTRARARAALGAALAALLVLGVVPATAGTADAPELTDIAGDANGINGQGPVSGPSQATPVQAASADLRAMWLETVVTESQVTAADGTVTTVQTPVALRWNVRTTAPASPSFGPSVIYRMPATVGGCSLFLESTVRGPASAPTDLQRGSLRLLTADACPTGPVRTLTAGITQSFAGDVMTVDFPLAASDGVLAANRTLASNGAGHSRVSAVAVTAPQIDEAQGDWSFRIGSNPVVAAP
jgi:hypothetical protein